MHLTASREGMPLPPLYLPLVLMLSIPRFVERGFSSVVVLGIRATTFIAFVVAFIASRCFQEPGILRIPLFTRVSNCLRP